MSLPSSLSRPALRAMAPARPIIARPAQPTTGLGWVSTVQLDGSNLRHLTSVLGYEVYPTSTRGGSSIVYREGDRLMIVDASGAKRLLLTTGGGPTWQGWARLSRDSAWVYFAGDGAIHRVRRDGSGYERLALPDGSALPGTQPDPAPDGVRLAYVIDGIIRSTRLAQAIPP